MAHHSASAGAYRIAMSVRLVPGTYFMIFVISGTRGSYYVPDVCPLPLKRRREQSSGREFLTADEQGGPGSLATAQGGLLYLAGS